TGNTRRRAIVRRPQTGIRRAGIVRGPQTSSTRHEGRRHDAARSRSREKRPAMRSAAAMVTISLGVASAYAQPSDRDAQARAAADEGAARFHDKDFAGAAKHFKDAYELNQDPSYLFNVAQAYRHAGDCVNAAEYYRRFLAEVPHPPNEDMVRAW